MKVWSVVVIAAACGIGVGGGMTWVEKLRSTEVFFPKDQQERLDAGVVSLQSGAGTQKWPKVELVDDGIFDFGSMERFSKLQHTFQLKNVGDALLTVRQGKSTCKCTLSELTKELIEPGETTSITLEWTGQTLGTSPDFQQSVEVITNVPDQEVVRLIIRGYVTETIRALPDELTLGRVSSNTGGEAEFRLFGFRSDQIEILETEFENPELEQYFELLFEPLSTAEVEAEKGASCGLLGKLTVKSGLPLGPINQTIRIRAMAEKEAVLHIPIRGQAMSDIIIASSREYEPNRSLLTLGTVKRSETASAVLHLFVTGPYRHETHLSVGAMDPPDCFRVEIGPRQELNDGKTMKYLVTIQIPPNHPPINRMGSAQAPHGRIVLETTHPLTKYVPIQVKFLIE